MFCSCAVLCFSKGVNCFLLRVFVCLWVFAFNIKKSFPGLKELAKMVRASSDKIIPATILRRMEVFSKKNKEEHEVPISWLAFFNCKVYIPVWKVQFFSSLIWMHQESASSHKLKLMSLQFVRFIWKVQFFSSLIWMLLCWRFANRPLPVAFFFIVFCFL